MWTKNVQLYMCENVTITFSTICDNLRINKRKGQRYLVPYSVVEIEKKTDPFLFLSDS